MACEDIATRIADLKADKQAQEEILNRTEPPVLAPKARALSEAALAAIEARIATEEINLANCLAGIGTEADISFTCLINALSPFIPVPPNFIPLGLIDEWLNLSRLLAKAAASRYGLELSEFPIFDLWWTVSEPARDLHGNASMSAKIDDELDEAWVRVAAIVNDKAAYTALGYQHVHRMSGEGRFVIFSDHHMAFDGSRQDFFHDSGNMDLYSQILNEYAECGFTLIENGDVEELVIHEPLAPPPPVVPEVRTAWRLYQLSQVIEHHKALYEQINTQFVDQDRYVRLAGNHDQDNQDERFLDKLRSVYPKLEQVYDFLVIEPAHATDATFVVAHGHHFDRSSTPRYANLIGEILSESLAWAYEGADRVWRWDGFDGVQQWANGTEPFNNTLVTDDQEELKINFDTGAAVDAALPTVLLTTALVNAGLAPLLLPVVAGGVAAAAAGLAGELSTTDLWEKIFNGNIAWEHFQSDDPGVAVFNEMLCGKAWFKFRHLDERSINEQLESKFASKVPYLVLGHSHEPRHRSWNPATCTQSNHYLNSGSAGRFGNLIWCVEIIDGEPQVVAWHRPGGPNSGEAPERRTYTPEAIGESGRLTASDRHVPLPPAAIEKKTTGCLAPLLHMMMSEP